MLEAVLRALNNWFECDGLRGEFRIEGGAIALPEGFRSKKHLEREVTVVGNTDHLEIWDRETWNRMQAEAEDELMDLFFS